MTASGPRLSGALGLCFCPVAVLVCHPEKQKSENSVCRVREGLHVGRRSPRSSAEGTNGISRAQSVSHGNAAFGLRVWSRKGRRQHFAVSFVYSHARDHRCRRRLWRGPGPGPRGPRPVFNLEGVGLEPAKRLVSPKCIES